MLHRFLMPDNFVQDPYSSLSYNRYGYAWNNPLMYTDPSGEFFVAALIGAAIGVVTNGIGNLIHNRPFLRGWGQAAFFGAIGGASSYGIGQAAGAISNSLGQAGASAITNTFVTGAFQAGSHALLGGSLSALQGGKFGAGALAGSISSVVASSITGIDTGSKGWNSVLRVGASGISGGIGSSIAGGKFIDGVRQGLISGGLNHGVHAGWFGKNITAAAITQRARHLFGPDARALSLNGAAGMGGGIKIEGGLIEILRGLDRGRVFVYDDFGLHASTPSISGAVAGTDLYFSGKGNFNRDVFFGLRYEANAGADFGLAVGITAVYAPIPSGNFVIGFGASVGFGASLSIIDVNFGLGETKRSFPWKNF